MLAQYARMFSTYLEKYPKIPSARYIGHIGSANRFKLYHLNFIFFFLRRNRFIGNFMLTQGNDLTTVDANNKIHTKMYYPKTSKNK